MSLKTFKPYTKSRRATVLVDKSGLWKGKPFKSLTQKKNSSRGRNNMGRITSRNTGGGHKQMYRQVDFNRKNIDMPAVVERIEYDPNRSCYIMLVKFDDGEHCYYLAPQKIKVGDKIENGSKKEIKKTKEMNLILNKFDATNSLFILDKTSKEKIYRSLKNIPNIKVTDVNHFSAFDIVKFKKIIFTESSIKELEKRYS